MLRHPHIAMHSHEKSFAHVVAPLPRFHERIPSLYLSLYASWPARGFLFLASGSSLLSRHTYGSSLQDEESEFFVDSRVRDAF